MTDFHTDNTLSHVSGTVGALTGEASAQANFGTLYAAATATSFGGALYSYGQGYAKFTDKLTITGGVGSADFLVDFSVTGSQSNDSVYGYPSGYLTWTNAPSGVGGGFLPNGNGTYAGVTPIHFTYGVPFDFDAELQTLALFPVGGTGTASASFTATISAVHILNGGHEVAGSISSDSGHSYPAAVPEPATFAALGLGLLGLSRKRK